MRGRGKVIVAVCILGSALVAGFAQAELLQKGTLRMRVEATLRPKSLPRTRNAPISVRVATDLMTTDGEVPPALETVRIELNRHGRLDATGLARCRIDQIQPASSASALAACGSSLVGRGSFSADVVLGGQKPYPTSGRLLVFSGTYEGHPALLGQIYAAHPFANSFVIPFMIAQRKHGAYGVTLTASLPRAFTSWGHITALDMRLSRDYSYRGRRRSFISAACPAPEGFSRAAFPFPLTRTSFFFAGGRKLKMTVVGSCRTTG